MTKPEEKKEQQTIHSFDFQKNITYQNLTDLDVNTLTELTFNLCTMVDDKVLNYLENLIELRILALCRMEVTNENLSHLVKLKKLKYLELSDCFNITNEGLVHIGKMSQLKVLILHKCISLTNAGINLHLKNMPELEKFVLRCFPISNFSFLSGMNNLEVFDFSDDRTGRVSRGRDKILELMLQHGIKPSGEKILPESKAETEKVEKKHLPHESDTAEEKKRKETSAPVKSVQPDVQLTGDLTFAVPVSSSSSGSMSTSISNISESKKPQKQDILQIQKKKKIISSKFRKIMEGDFSIKDSASTLKALITFYKPDLHTLPTLQQEQLCRNFLKLQEISDDSIKTLATYLQVSCGSSVKLNPQVKTDVGDELWKRIKDVEPDQKFLLELNNILNEQASVGEKDDKRPSLDTPTPSPQVISLKGVSPIYQTHSKEFVPW